MRYRTFVISDYTNPLGVSTYKTSKIMSEILKQALPDIEDLRKLIDDSEGEK